MNSNFAFRVVAKVDSKETAVNRSGDIRRVWAARRMFELPDSIFAELWPGLSRIIDDPAWPTAPEKVKAPDIEALHQAANGNGNGNRRAGMPAPVAAITVDIGDEKTRQALRAKGLKV